jgi:protease IV
MRQFFKFMFASMLGFLLTLFIVVLLLVAMVSALVKSSSSQVIDVSSNSILKLDFKNEIMDRASNNPFENFDFSDFKTSHQLGLNEILKDIKKAKEDENITGIFLDLSTISAGIATVDEIRNALIDFKKSKKFIISYSEFYTQKSYYLASVANEIYLNPAGSMDWKGMSAQVLFFKGTLEKLELEPEIIRHGKFKSAVEPFLLDKMSAASRIQTKSFIGSIWNHMLEGISQQRKIEVSELNRLASTLAINTADDAIAFKLIDKKNYFDEVEVELKKRSGITPSSDISFISIQKYHKVPAATRDRLAMDKIAVIFAQGDIESGEGDEKSIGSESIAAALREARLDKKVKAIVLRVNSPGGSALASDVIWRETMLAKKEKPLVVSMGDYAASGGYYISCAANKIVASPTTITGSIGVFGLLFNSQKLLNNKLGITIDTVNTNAHADFGTALRPLTADERLVMQNSVERVYDDFISKVASGRNKSKAEIDSIGQGRVWSGTEALKLGLVDELGGLDKAIAVAAKLANMSTYRIFNLPKQKDPLERIMTDISGEVESKLLKEELGQSYRYIKQLCSFANSNHSISARMEYMLELY